MRAIHVQAYDVETNRMSFNAEVDTRSMWEFYLPVFHSCLVEAKAMHAMCSYNDLNGACGCPRPEASLRTERRSKVSGFGPWLAGELARYQLVGSHGC